MPVDSSHIVFPDVWRFFFLVFIRNALNIVKDDLIVKVDELTGEIEILREELNTANQARTKLRQKVSDLEDELKQNKTLAKAHGESIIIDGYSRSSINVFFFSICSQLIQIKKTKAMCQWRNANVSLGLKWHVCWWKEIK